METTPTCDECGSIVELLGEDSGFFLVCDCAMFRSLHAEMPDEWT